MEQGQLLAFVGIHADPSAGVRADLQSELLFSTEKRGWIYDATFEDGLGEIGDVQPGRLCRFVHEFEKCATSGKPNEARKGGRKAKMTEQSQPG